MADTDQLGRFGHHPDPSNDFCIQVEALDGRLYSAINHISKPGEQPESVLAVLDDIRKAMDFRVGGDPIAVSAKDRLREIESYARKELKGAA